MTVVLDSTFAEPEDVGKTLGVPKSRVRWLKRLGMVGRKFEDKNGTRVSASAKKRKQARGKVKKVSR